MLEDLWSLIKSDRDMWQTEIRELLTLADTSLLRPFKNKAKTGWKGRVKIFAQGTNGNTCCPKTTLHNSISHNLRCTMMTLSRQKHQRTFNLKEYVLLCNSKYDVEDSEVLSPPSSKYEPCVKQYPRHTKEENSLSQGPGECQSQKPKYMDTEHQSKQRSLLQQDLAVALQDILLLPIPEIKWCDKNGDPLSFIGLTVSAAFVSKHPSLVNLEQLHVRHPDFFQADSLHDHAKEFFIPRTCVSKCKCGDVLGFKVDDALLFAGEKGKEQVLKRFIAKTARGCVGRLTSWGGKQVSGCVHIQ
ncbi:hypothetical protein ACROYT_G014931 [Oculina patagonica]